MARSGVITVTTAGTAVNGPNQPGREFIIKAHADNTDTIYVGNDGADDVAAANGFPLNAGESVPLFLNNLKDLWFDADVSGEKVAWIQFN